MRSAIRMLPPLLVVLALPALAQTLAPAPRALAAATAVHPCMAPPQGQGPTSAECKRECERNPQAMQCPRSNAVPATPNWSAPVAGSSGTAAAVSNPSAGGGMRPAAAAPPIAAPGVPASALSASSAGAPAAPMPMAPRPNPSPQQRTPAALAPTQATPVTTPAASASPVQQGSSGVATAAVKGVAVLEPVEATPVTTPAVSANPVQPASQAASRAAANATIPGAAESPRIQAESFVVDFGKAFSGDQVRRTVVLNMTAAGEAEFILNAQAALGFSIAEVRTMGAGAGAPPPAGTTPLSQRNNTMAVRQVAQRVSAPPWKLRVSEPTELQVDVVYAPKFDAFNNMAGAKSVQLDARVRNVRGEGMGVPFELRAQFQGLPLGVSVALKTPEVYLRASTPYDYGKPLDALEPAAITLSIANLSGAALPVRIEGGSMPTGVSADVVELTLKKDEKRDIAVPLKYVALYGFEDSDAKLIVQAAGRRSEVVFRVTKVVERHFAAVRENWSVGVMITPTGWMHVYAACWLKFPQTRNVCRFNLDAGGGVRRKIVLIADTGTTSACFYAPARIGAAGQAPTSQEIVAVIAANKEVLRSVDGTTDPGPGTFFERHVLEPVRGVQYHDGCDQYLLKQGAPFFGPIR